MKKTTLSVVAIAAFLGQASAASEIARDDATRPIIAQMLSNPDAYANKPVTIYGLVIEKNPIWFSFYRTFPSGHLRWSERVASKRLSVIRSRYAASSQRIAMACISRRVRSRRRAFLVVAAAAERTWKSTIFCGGSRS